MVASVDACAAALVREYLSRKGYKQALAALDGERGLTERDLTSRADIVERLQLQPLVKQNRSQLDPVSTLLELILVSREKGLRASGASSGSGSSAKPTTPQSIEPAVHAAQLKWMNKQERAISSRDVD